MPNASSRTTASRSSSRGAELPALRALVDAGWSLGLARRVAVGGASRLARAAEVFPVRRSRRHAPSYEPLDALTVERAARRCSTTSTPSRSRCAPRRRRTAASPTACRWRSASGGRGSSGSARTDLALVDALAIPLGAAFPQLDAARAPAHRSASSCSTSWTSSTRRRRTGAWRASCATSTGSSSPPSSRSCATEGVFVAELLDGRTVSRRRAAEGCGARPRRRARRRGARRDRAARRPPGPRRRARRRADRAARRRRGAAGRSSARRPGAGRVPVRARTAHARAGELEAAQDVWLARSAAHLAATVAASS